MSSIDNRTDFSFPYPKPYEIQLNFMRALYKCLENKNIGIFESPTGTGKSLSLICGSLSWLQDFKENQVKNLKELIEEEQKKKKETESSSSGAFDWLTEHETNFEKNETKQILKEELKKQIDQENKYKELKNQAKQKAKRKRDDERVILQNKSLNKQESDKKDDVKSDDMDIILDDYFSDDEESSLNEDSNNDLNENQTIKIFYCSRTHSQLSQFIGELRKTKFANTTRLVTLGSRMNLCINDTVLKLGSLQLVNERCIELQKTKKNTTSCGSKKSKLDNSKACCYYKPSQFEEFNVKLMEEIFDIEDVVKAGHETKICPYYGSRYSIPTAELIALPYNILFQKETRQSFGINLKDQIVIVDEAHNLLDTITQIHSIEISSQHVIQARNQLNSYFDKYKSRLSAKNVLYVKQLLNVLNGLNSCFLLKDEDKKLSTNDGKLGIKYSKLWTLNEFFAETKFYNMNFIKLLRFCDETKLEKKLIGFHEKYTQTKEDKKQESNSEEVKLMKSPLMQIKSFIKVISSTLFDGRILLNIDTSSKSTLKFILLNPDKCFEEILKECRSVILAGGTMKPISDFEQLIGDKTRIEYFSCDHVIPKENIFPFGLATSLNGIKFDFSYNSRDNNQILDELGNELIYLCKIVPSGIVVFFVSYDYMDKVIGHFKKAKNNYILTKIAEKKQIFYEPKTSIECEKVFDRYTKVIKSPTDGKTGALLFAVVGGKMSEGINFSDDLGRCVIVVGQPYANIKSLELQEKMQYLNKTQAKLGGKDGKQPGQVYYENLCWKAINQTIGRAIRHQNDYASIILIDSRYCTMTHDNLNDKLPKWICESFKRESKELTSKNLHERLELFFKSKAK